jgi:hypothetical protein
MKRSLWIGAAAFAFAATPLLAAAMPRAAASARVAGSDNAVILAHGDREHAWGHVIKRDRDDAWSRGLRRFRSSFD